MQPDAARGGEPLIQGVADEDVRETKAIGGAGNVGEHARGDRLVERVEQLIL